MKQIKNKLILITGASSGIGEATAKLLAKGGAHVLLMARNENNLLRVQNDIEKFRGVANYYSVDLSDYKAVNETVGKMKNQVGVPDVIINNAGAGNWLSLFETSNEDYIKMQTTPHLAAFYVTKAIIPYMLEKGSGHIINLNSASCYFSYPGAMGYLSSRWGLRSFNEALYNELYNTAINVTMVVAGKVDSPYFTNNPISEERIPKIATKLTRTLSVEQVAKAIAKNIGTNKRTIIIPYLMKVMVFMNRFFPRLFERLLRRTGYTVNPL